MSCSFDADVHVDGERDFNQSVPDYIGNQHPPTPLVIRRHRIVDVCGQEDYHNCLFTKLQQV